MFKRKPGEPIDVTQPEEPAATERVIEGSVSTWQGVESSNTEYLRERVRILERQVDELKHQLTSRVRLQDLDRTELASSALGAAGEIVQAARMQADELIAEAEALRQNALGESRDLYIGSRTKATELIEEAEDRARLTIEAAQQTSLDREAAAAAEAQRRLDDAHQSTERMISAAQDEARRLVEKGEKTLADADAAAQITIQNAQAAADRINAESIAFFNTILTNGGEAITLQRETFAAIIGEGQGLRSKMSEAIASLRNALESASSRLATAEVKADAFLLRLDQYNSELESMRASMRAQTAALSQKRPAELNGGYSIGANS